MYKSEEMTDKNMSTQNFSPDEYCFASYEHSTHSEKNSPSNQTIPSLLLYILQTNR